MRSPKTDKGKLFLLLAVDGGLLLLSVLFAVAYTVAEVHGSLLFDCVFRRTLGIYCPGCGGSRAVLCLLRFDVIKAVFYYPPLPVACLWLLAFNIVYILDLAQKTDRYSAKFPARTAYAIPVAIILCFFVRLILLFCGIDALGDFT